MAVYDRFFNAGRRRWTLVATIVLLFFAFFTLRSWGSMSSDRTSNTASTSEVLAAHFHLLIPADHKDVNLCKTLLSAAVSGLPTPILINWGAKFDNKKLVAGGSHLAKISGVLKYLQSLAPEHDDDLVLVVDGYDLWFQLRPSTLISRYHEINAAANVRIEKSMGQQLFKAAGIEQTIVFSAQKRCWPFKPTDPPCSAVPESSMPKNVYGPQTDTDVGFDKNPYLKFRQRYLNSGNAMGRVRSMRALFEHAMVKMEADPNFGSDQKIFSEIFGDQEVQRAEMRKHQESSVRRWIDWIRGKKVVREKSPNEFGIGLDYASLLGHPTVFCEEDAAWIKHNDTGEIERASKELGTPLSRIGELSEDIARSQLPFRVPVPLPDSDLPTEEPWSNVSLYTNMWTSVVPSLIHHNAHRDGLKSLRKTWWDRPWFFQHARKLYESYTAGPVGPIAVEVRDGKETSWWSPMLEKGGARADEGEFLTWNDMCSEFDKELFRGH